MTARSGAHVACCLGLVFVLGACSSGGGSPGPSAGRPTATPSATPDPGGSTTFAVSSVPSGMNITYSDGIGTADGATPVTLAPFISNVAFAITFEPSNGNALYTYVGAQRNDGAHPIFYNQYADTSGSLVTIGTSAVARRIVDDATARRRASLEAAREPRRAGIGSAGRPHQSATRVVVRYREPALRAGTSIARGRALGPASGGIVTYAVDVPPATTAVAYARALMGDPGVISAVPDVYYYTQSTTAVLPDDTRFSDYQQWNLFSIRAPNAWGYTLGNPAVQIAIVDTGADFHHADFAGSKITYAESDLSGVTTPGAAAAQDTDGHGTNVAGIAGADTNNAFAFAGAGYNVGLQIYKVFPDETAGNDYTVGALSSDVTLAIYHAVAHGARVINLSLGGCAARGIDLGQQAAIDYALANGVLVVAAAGNERASTSTDPFCTGVSASLDFPGGYDGVLSVGATKLDDGANPGVFATAKESVASYSNAAPGLSLVAPGGDPPADEANGTVPPDLLHWIEGLYTTTPGNPARACSNPADCHALFAGTSQATPLVSATAALLLSVAPGLSVANLRALILNNTDDIGDPLQGNGRLDAYRALAAVTGDPIAPATPAARNFVAFAYVPNGTARPKILDVTYPAGVGVNSDGTFRVADVPAGSTYKIGVWYDANGDGVVDAGDYFGSSGSCTAVAACTSASAIHALPVVPGFTLN